VLAGRCRAWLLRKRIASLRPCLVHALELQHAGYLVLRARKQHGKMPWPSLAVTNYGSDLFWFQRIPRHRQKLEQLLEVTDFYFAECMRDVELAKGLGFRGRTLKVLPNAGGVVGAGSIDPSALPAVSQRRIVLIKGYTNFVGRAQDVLQELAARSGEFVGWDIVVYSATLRARLMCRRLSQRDRTLSLKALPKKSLSHAQMLSLFESAAAYVGFSKSDGVSTSFLEALCAGAYPLQTSTACVDEWAEKGAVFTSLNVDDPRAAVDELIRVLADEPHRRLAMESNARVAREHLDADAINKEFEREYRLVLGL